MIRSPLVHSAALGWRQGPRNIPGGLFLFRALGASTAAISVLHICEVIAASKKGCRLLTSTVEVRRKASNVGHNKSQDYAQREAETSEARDDSQLMEVHETFGNRVINIKSIFVGIAATGKHIN